MNDNIVPRLSLDGKAKKRQTFIVVHSAIQKLLRILMSLQGLELKAEIDNYWPYSLMTEKDQDAVGLEISLVYPGKLYKK